MDISGLDGGSAPFGHGSLLHRRRSVGVAEHRVEGVGKVVGLRAVVLLGHGQQERQHHQEEQQEVQGQRHPQDATQK